MKIEIWSDVVCPFCYIGKRHFEKALEQFAGKDDVQIEWKSFLLNPAMKTDPEKNITEYLAEIKGISLQQASEMNAHVSKMAEGAGLQYDFSKVVMANSYNAHRLIQFAKQHSLADAVEERLFRAYFIEGKNIDNEGVLISIANETGLDGEAVAHVLSEKKLSAEVNADIGEAQQLGIRGVPFFVVDRKFGISGAQPVEVFIETLEKAARGD